MPKITRVSFPEHIESIDYENIISEAVMVNCVYITGILSDFLEDKELIPTISGRMGSGDFSFYIRNVATSSSLSVTVANSQIEIDGGYESIEQLVIIEAKKI